MIRPLTLALLALSVAATAQAQTVVPLDRALELARTESLPVLRAAAQVASADASVAALDDGRWPRLSLSLGGGQRYGLAFDQTTGDLTQATVEAVDVGVSASYVVFDGFERRAAIRAAEATVRAAELDGVRAGQEAERAVLAGYLDAAEAKALRRIAEANEAAERRLLEEVEAQVAFGARAPSELDQQRERVAAAQGAALQADRQLARAHAGLVRTLGLDPAGRYAFPLPEAPLSEERASEAVLIERALAARADVQAARAARRSIQADRRAARAARLPQVALVGSVGTSYTSANDATGFAGQVGDNRSGSLGLRVSLPILDQGATRSGLRRAEARALAVDADAESVRRTIAFEVQEALADRRQLDAEAEVARVRLEAAQSALDAELARFQAGTTTLQAVAQLRSRRLDAEVTRERITIRRRVQARWLELVLGDARGGVSEVRARERQEP